MQYADIVDGILVRDGKFLVEKRRLDEDIDPGLVCIPGGHVDDGESLENALKREMKEELGIDIKEAKMFFKGPYTASNGENEMIYYFLVSEWEGEPNALEAEKVFWEADAKRLSIDIDRKAIHELMLEGAGL